MSARVLRCVQPRLALTLNPRGLKTAARLVVPQNCCGNFPLRAVRKLYFLLDTALNATLA